MHGEKIFNYYYDASGDLTAIKYRLEPVGKEYAYYVTHNWRGDVVGLYDDSGNLLENYVLQRKCYHTNFTKM